MKEGDLILVSAEATGLGKPMEAIIDKIETFMGQTSSIAKLSSGGNNWRLRRISLNIILLSFKVGSINSIFYFLHKAAEPFNCLEQDNLA